MAPIDFDYDLEEIVQISRVGEVSLKSVLKRMPDPVGRYGVLHRDRGKMPPFFDSFQTYSIGTDLSLTRATRPATAKPTRMIFRSVW